MAQRYTSPKAQENMRNDLCPECGRRPAVHSSDTFTAMLSPCQLMRPGVEERIEQYRQDQKDILRDEHISGPTGPTGPTGHTGPTGATE